MPTLSIELTEDEHRRLEEGAAKAGSTLPEFVRTCLLTDAGDMAELAAVLRSRIERADKGEVFGGSVTDIAKSARARLVR